MGELWLFVRAVAHHWATLLTGGLIMALVGLFERWTLTNVPGWVFWGLVAAFLFAAFFLAWRDQYRVTKRTEMGVDVLTKELADERDRNHPRLTGRIEQVGVGDTERGLGAMVEMTVTNTGTPSIAENWELEIHTQPSLRAGALALPDGDFVFGGDAIEVTVERGNALNEKTLTPIPSGGLARGWLFFSVATGNRDDVMRPGIMWTVSFTDVEGRRQSASMAMRHGGDAMMAYRPGTGVRIRRIPREPTAVTEQPEPPTA